MDRFVRKLPFGTSAGGIVGADEETSSQPAAYSTKAPAKAGAAAEPKAKAKAEKGKGSSKRQLLATRATTSEVDDKAELSADARHPEGSPCRDSPVRRMSQKQGPPIVTCYDCKEEVARSDSQKQGRTSSPMFLCNPCNRRNQKINTILRARPKIVEVWV